MTQGKITKKELLDLITYRGVNDYIKERHEKAIKDLDELEKENLKHNIENLLEAFSSDQELNYMSSLDMFNGWIGFGTDEVLEGRNVPDDIKEVRVAYISLENEVKTWVRDNRERIAYSLFEPINERAQKRRKGVLITILTITVVAVIAAIVQILLESFKICKIPVEIAALLGCFDFLVGMIAYYSERQDDARKGKISNSIDVIANTNDKDKIKEANEIIISKIKEASVINNLTYIGSLFSGYKSGKGATVNIGCEPKSDKEKIKI